MALETLIASQIAAAEILGVDYAEIEAVQQVEPHYLGNIVLRDVDKPMPAYRVHTGPSGLIAKGGIRMFDYGDPRAALTGATELSGEMLPKVWARGYADRFRGGKGVISVDPRTLSSEQKKEAATQYANLMMAAGFAHHLVDVPAGDMGTNGLSDAYVQAVHSMDRKYKYWQATATGKSPEQGGLDFRTEATGFGVYVTQRMLMQERGIERATTTLQGFGNVGAWYGYHASNDPTNALRLQAISEQEGTLYTDDPAGFHITEDMVRTIGDNPNFRGSKLAALRERIQANQPGLRVHFSSNRDDILTYPTDYFVPAAGGDVINAANVAHLGARLGIIDAANGPVTPEAHQYLTMHKMDNMPDFIANGAGVDCSIVEYDANVAAINPEAPATSNAHVKAYLRKTAETLTRQVLEASHHMGTRDLRVAASGIYIAKIIPGALELAA